LVVEVGKWSLSHFKGKTSGIQQTGEMMALENTSDMLWSIKIRSSRIQLSLS